jgi:transketolase
LFDYKIECKEIRKLILKTIGTLGVGHIGGSLSIVELLVVLYEKHMNIDPQNPKMSGRDRLIVSKGHSGPAVYSILCKKGYFPEDWLLTLNQSGTKLPSHCDMNLTPGIDMTTGSLGQGFSCAVGIAKASQIKKDGATIFAIIGDGETQEGQIWEAAMFAAQHKLNNLIAFTDYNKMQIDGTIQEICALEPLQEKWRSFGFEVIEIKNGHDCDEIDSAICSAKLSQKPSMLILNTTKGKGVPFVEKAGVDCHSMPISNYDTLTKEICQI